MDEPVKKKKRRIKGKVRLSTLFFLAVTLASNTFAWFVYNTRVTSSIETSVRQWKLSFDVNGADMSTDVTLDVDNIYPGMETNTQNLRITNSGQMSASITYEILECSIVGENLLSLGLTDEEVISKLKNDYPFTIDFNINTGIVTPDDDENIGLIVSWPYEGGNDSLDTYWGNEAYYYNQRTGLPSIVIKIRISAIQTESSDGKLPSNYQEVEFIQSNGDSYINLGYLLTNSITPHKVDVKFDPTSSGRNVFGMDGDTNDFRLFLDSQGDSHYNLKSYVGSSELSGGIFSFGPRSAYMEAGINALGNQKLSITVDGGERLETTYSGAMMPTYSGSNLSMYLFSANRDDTPYLNFQGKIYYFKLYKNNSLVRNMVPCYVISSGEIGMYDKANSKFYSNLGSTPFTKGPDVIDS